MNYSPDMCHKKLLKNIKPSLSYSENCDYNSWRESVRKKLSELLGDTPQKTQFNIRTEWESDRESFIERRIIFTPEENVEAPCHLWIPKNVKKPCPVVICLQGHTTGMHISMGRSLYEGDEIKINNCDSDFARQIVREGYAALILEQRGFGERKSDVMLKGEPELKKTCLYPAMTALMMGRTLIGERVWDVSRAIDLLETLPEIDSERIALMGNSGGGTVTYYAACMDERIKAAMPSCSVCTFEKSIVAKRHCSCNYIPDIAKYVDMGDLACLIAPRPLVVVAGDEDPIFFIDGVKEAYGTIEKIYERAGAPDKCRLVIGSGGHRFYSDNSWHVFKGLTNW